ncbi:MAG: helix-turn-helix transcriptional regulator [Limnochordia bacterium]
MAWVEDVIRLALAEGQGIEFDYINGEGEATTRVVQPLILFAYQTAMDEFHTYVSGFCELRGEYRTFRLDRIADVKCLPGSGPLELDSDNLLDDVWQTFNPGRMKILEQASPPVYERPLEPVLPDFDGGKEKGLGWLLYLTAAALIWLFFRR